MIVYRRTVLEEGLFDQIRVDHGKEFYLTLYGQECLAHLRRNPRRDPHRQTESKKVFSNHILFNENFIEFYEILKFIVCLVES